jgi:HlyD family secretion protein
MKPGVRRYTSLLLRVGVLLVVAAAALGGWAYWRQNSQMPAEQRYQLEEIGYGDVTQSVSANGTLNPVVLVNVGTQVSGTVKKLYADFNSKVTAGQVLLELDPTTFRAAVEQSSGNVANAEAALKLARANEQRTRELFALEYVSKQDLDQAIQAREAAQAQLQTSRGQLAKDRANLAYSIIRSPVSGVVVSRQIDVGQTVAASFQTPTLFQIAQDLSQMQIDSNVAEADIGKIKTGLPVRFTVDAFPGRRFEGKVKQIRLNPINQQNVVTYDVVVGVSNPDLKLMPGMTAYVSFVIDERSNVLLAPNAALRFRPRDPERDGKKQNSGGKRARDSKPSGAKVYVLHSDVIAPVPVTLGITDGRYTEVLSGELKAGDRVVLEDNQPDQGRGPQPFRMRPF